MHTLIFLLLQKVFLTEYICNVEVPMYFDSTIGKKIELKLFSVVEYDLQFYDNWGREISSLSNLNNETYYYKIDYKCKSGNQKVKEGQIELLNTLRR